MKIDIESEFKKIVYKFSYSIGAEKYMGISVFVDETDGKISIGWEQIPDLLSERKDFKVHEEFIFTILKSKFMYSE